MSPHSLTAVTGNRQDLVSIKRVLVSVFDKTEIVNFCTFLQKEYQVEILSTGGTASSLRASGLIVQDVSDYTGHPECFDGRVKTLHPKIHGGFLAVRGNEKHEQEVQQYNIPPIDMTIVNLYPFEETCRQENNNTYEQCIENIDIGGPSMIRSTAKNHVSTTIVTSPSQYEIIQQCMKDHQGCTTYQLRQSFAYAAYALTASYDSMIAQYLQKQVASSVSSSSNGEANGSKALVLPPPTVVRVYEPKLTLKYGCNPHQNPSIIYQRINSQLPFSVLNGTPGYINLLDACNAYQLVTELSAATDGLPAATSFKHVSPAGAAVYVPLSDLEYQIYDISDKMKATLTPTAIAYLRARQADPLCSYGDFAAVSHIVDEATASYLKMEVSDGIIAPGYTPEALAILTKKKGGKFIILQGTTGYHSDDMEYREVYGMTFSQRRNDLLLTSQHMTQQIVTSEKNITDNIIRDMLVASICIKYTQSNSVGYSYNGMMIGVGAGQQSRVDCVKLAGQKVKTWYMRQHPAVMGLSFASHVKRQERVNARVQYIQDDMTEIEKMAWEKNFTTVPEPLSKLDGAEAIHSYMKTLTGVTIASDAFFPFRDSIDVASKYGVSYIAQPGGSIQDQEVINACNDYHMIMSFTGVRLFHH